MTHKDATSTTNDGFSLQISSNSSLSCESDLSSFSFDKEIDTYSNRMHSDELPAFEIRLISPLGRSPSPIDSDIEFPSSPSHCCITPTRKPSSKKAQTSYKDNEDFVPLHDINAQISPPSDNDSNALSDNSLSNSLETIYEGVFLNTPPKAKQQLQRSNSSSSRNLMEKIAINRLNFAAALGKENMLEKGGSHGRSGPKVDD